MVGLLVLLVVVCKVRLLPLQQRLGVDLVGRRLGSPLPQGCRTLSWQVSHTPGVLVSL